jgi:aspartate/methionine/tyrosine aminotransferase
MSLTGWRVGWVTGPETLVTACRTLHTYSTYCE